MTLRLTSGGRPSNFLDARKTHAPKTQCASVHVGAISACIQFPDALYVCVVFGVKLTKTLDGEIFLFFRFLGLKHSIPKRILPIKVILSCFYESCSLCQLMSLHCYPLKIVEGQFQ